MTEGRNSNAFNCHLEYLNITTWLIKWLDEDANDSRGFYTHTHLCVVTVLVHLKGTLFRAVSSPSAPLFTAAPLLRVHAGVYCKEETKRKGRKQAAAGPLVWTADGKGRSAGKGGGRRETPGPESE